LLLLNEILYKEETAREKVDNKVKC